MKNWSFRTKKRGKRAAELVIANEEPGLSERGRKVSAPPELVIANKELVFQNKEKEKRAAEFGDQLIKSWFFQNEEKDKRAAELVIANEELVFQNEEKGKRAAELAIANEELVFQNEEKGKRAAELVVTNNELVFQNEEKEKRAAELAIANKELLAFTYISSHDLQEPLRKIRTFATIILEKEVRIYQKKGKIISSACSLRQPVWKAAHRRCCWPTPVSMPPKKAGS